MHDRPVIRSSTVVVMLLIGLLFLAMWILAAPGAKAAWDVDGPDFLLRIQQSPIDPIPPAPQGGTPWDMAAAKANRGSSFWSYLRESQNRIAWFGMTVLPDDPDGDMIWYPGMELAVRLEDGTTVPGEWVTAANCGKTTLCDLVTTPVRASWSDIAVTTQRGRLWMAYLGVPRDRIRSHRVVGVTLEVSR